MNILICGGSGFIGKNLVERFSSIDKFNIRSTFFRKKPNMLPNVDYIQADLRKIEDVKNALNDIDIVFQYAATTTGAKDIISKPYIHVTDNAVMNSILIRQAFENNVKHFIFPSCTVMYKHSSKPLIENDFNESENIYHKYYGAGNTKVYLEKMCKFFSSFNKTKFIVLRQSNIYGPHDKFDLENSHVLAATITKVMSKNQTIKVWGDGTEKRDFLFIDDLIELLIKIINTQNNQYELINTSFGHSISISDLVKTIIKIADKNISLDFDTDKPTIPIDLLIDNQKACELFNWSPKYDLEAGLRLTLNWYKKNIQDT